MALNLGNLVSAIASTDALDSMKPSLFFKPSSDDIPNMAEIRTSDGQVFKILD